MYKRILAKAALLMAALFVTGAANAQYNYTVSAASGGGFGNFGDNYPFLTPYPPFLRQYLNNDWQQHWHTQPRRGGIIRFASLAKPI